MSVSPAEATLDFPAWCCWIRPFLGAAQGPVIILVSMKSSLEPAKGNGYVAATKQAQPKGQDKSALNMPNSIVAFVENNRYLCVVDKS